jgi:perosamine synthetase
MIPVCEPVIGEREHELVEKCLHTGWISSAGEFLECFEQRWAARCGMEHGIAVSSGTAALHLAVSVLDLEPGDEVILPTFTIISCANAVIQAGGVPVLVDSDQDTWCMDVEAVAERIGPRTRAIMAVHIYGHPVDIDPLRRLADTHGLVLIEDAAEAHGARYLSGRESGKPRWLECGGLGDLSTFSFYANKLITTGEGGMVLTSNPEVAERIRRMRNLCFDAGRRFEHRELGYNYRLTNIQAALGVGQLERFDEIIEAKRTLGKTYADRLRKEPRIELQREEPWARSVFWMNGLVLADDLDMDAAAFASALRAEGVETRPFFLGMHEQPAFHDRGLFLGERYPVAERLARRGLYLPSGIGLTTAQVNDVERAIQEVLS